MLVYRTVSGIAAMVLGAIILVQMLAFAPHDGAKVIVGAVLGIAMIVFGGHRIALVWRAGRTP